MDGYAFSSCDLARLAAEASGLSVERDGELPGEERIRLNIIQVTPRTACTRWQPGICMEMRASAPACRHASAHRRLALSCVKLPLGRVNGHAVCVDWD